MLLVLAVLACLRVLAYSCSCKYAASSDIHLYGSCSAGRPETADRIDTEYNTTETAIALIQNTIQRNFTVAVGGIIWQQ